MPHAIFDEDAARKLVRDYEAGASTVELARQRGCNDRTVANTLVRYGVVLRHRGAVGTIESSPRLEKRVLALREKGLSFEAIAEKVGLSPNAVGRFLRRLGRGAPLGVGGERHGRWKGGRTMTGDGYVLVWVPPEHPMASMRNKTGYILEHRLVMAEHLGRPLTQKETVHHIDDDHENNEIENLQLRRGRHGKHACFRCSDCGSANVRAVPL